MKRNTLKRILSLLMAVCMVLGVTEPLSLKVSAAAVTEETTVYYSEDFEDIPQLDWVPRNHEGKTPSDDDLSKAYASLVADPMNEDNQVMKLNITNGRSQWVGAGKVLSARPNVGVLSYRLYLGSNTGTVTLPSFRYITNSSQGAWSFAVMAVNGKLQLALTQTCNIRQIVYTATEALSAQWHDITLMQKVSSSPAALDYALYIDGVLAYQGQLNTENCTYLSGANLAMSGIFWSSSWTAAEAYIDDLRVTEHVPATALSLTDAEGNTGSDMLAGDMRKLAVAVQPVNADCFTINYSSGNQSVAKVDENGNITAVGAGITAITATLENFPAGNASPLTAIYEVSVAEPAVEYYFEDFNSISQLDWVAKNHSNEIPSETQAALAYTTVETDPLDGKNSVLKLNVLNNPGQWVGAVKRLTAAPEIGVLSYRLYLEDNEGSISLPSFRNISASNSQGAWFFSVMAVGGKLQLALCQTCNIRQIVYTATEALSDEWHDIKLVQRVQSNPKTLDYALFVDGSLVCYGQLNEDNCTYLASANMSMTGLSWTSNWATAKAYIDDIGVSEAITANRLDRLDFAEGHSGNLYKGGFTKVTASFSPAFTSAGVVSYSSSDESVAMVDAFGKVTAVNAGTAVIRAVAQPVSGLTSGDYKEITVTVQEPDFGILEDFEQYEVGQTPNDWDVIVGENVADKLNAAVEVDPLDAANQIFTISANLVHGENLEIKKTFDDNLTGTKAVLSYRFKPGYITGLTYLPNFADSNNQNAFSVGVIGSGLMIHEPLDNTWPSIGPKLGAEQWHDVVIVLDTERDVYDFYLDGQLIQHRETEKDLSGINGIDWGFYAAAAGTVSTLSIDDLKVTRFIEASEVTLAQSQVTLAVGGSVPLKLVFEPDNASYRSAVFTSSAEGIVTVDANGVLTGVAPGNAAITVVPNGVADAALSVNVTVVDDIPVTDIVLNTAEIDMPVGGHVFLETSVLPKNAGNQELSYSTDNSGVVSVDDWGEIVALQAGTAEITVSADDGKVKKTVMVTVTVPETMKTIYVAPNGTGNGESAASPTTLANALQIIAQIDKTAMTGNIVVSMASGYYQQFETLALDENHGGNGMYSVVFRAENGQSVTIGGGIQVPGSSFTPAEGLAGVYVAELPEGVRSRQLYIDNVIATRAKSSWLLSNAQLLYNESDVCIGYLCDDDGILSKYVNNQASDDLEIVYEHSWRSYRIGIDSVNLNSDGNVEIILDEPALSYALKWGIEYLQPEHILRLENAVHLLDEPGEWYLDETDNKLYYMPRTFENMAEVTVTIPVTEALVTVSGTNYDNMVQNVIFEGITFADATWMRPSTDAGHICAQNNYLDEMGQNYLNFSVDASITVTKANSVSFVGCTFTRLGTTGLKLTEGVQNSQIADCKFYEIAGGAIQIGEPGFGNSKYNVIKNYNPSDIRMLMKNCDVVNNYIHDVATQYRSAAAIGIGFMVNAELSHNEIFNIPYSGFHIGYGWGAEFDAVTRNLQVTNNFIHDLLGDGVYDGGAIYTIGNTGGGSDSWNLIARNYIRNQMNGPAVLYADNGSTYWSWEENIVDLSMVDYWEYKAGAPRWFFANTDAHDVRVMNNYTTISNYSVASSAADYVTISGTEVAQDAQWQGAAMTIAQQAGLNHNAQQLRNGQIEIITSNLPDNGKSLVIYSGDTFEIELELTDGRDNVLSKENADTIAYDILDRRIAVVSENGHITAVSPGVTTLYVYVVSNDVLYTLEREVKVVYYGEDFDSITEFDWIPQTHESKTPSDYNLSKAYASVATDPLDADNKVMKLNISTLRTNWVGAVKQLTTVPEIGVLNYRLYLGSNSGTICLPSFRHVANGTQSAWCFSLMAVGNKLQLALCQTCNVRQIVYTAEEALSAQWHDITLVQRVSSNPKTLDYVLYVDGILVCEGQLNEENCSYLSTANISMTGLSWSATWTAGEAYIDDLTVTEQVSAASDCTVTYVADGETVVRFTVTEGGSVPAVPAVPEKTGYTGIWDHDGTNITADTTITAVYTAKAVVEAYNLSLGGDIGMNFYIRADADTAAKTQVEIAAAGKTVSRDLCALEQDTGGNYVMSVAMAAAQMTEMIVLKLIIDGEIVKNESYSVYDYAKVVLADESLRDSHALVREMLNYGSSAQTYFVYNTDNMIDASYISNAGVQEVSAADVPTMCIDGDVEGISYYGATLVFNANTAVRFYFNVNGDINSYTFNNGVLKPVEKNGLYYVEIADINPQSLNESVTLKVTGGDDVLTVSYSPMNYIVRMSAKGSDDLRVLLKAMYNYHKTALEYAAV